MDQCRSHPLVFRMAMDGKAQLTMAVPIDDIVIAGLDDTCRDFPAALVTKSPTDNLGELTWYTGFQKRLGIGDIGGYAEGLG